VHGKDKKDVVCYGQKVRTPPKTASKKETLKRPFSSLEGSITKLLTLGMRGEHRESLSIPLLAFIPLCCQFPIVASLFTKTLLVVIDQIDSEGILISW